MINILPLSSKEILQIIAINAGNIVDKAKLKSGEVNLSSGFLLGRLEEEYLTKIISNKNHLALIAKEDNNLTVGYLLAHNILEAKLSIICLKKIAKISADNHNQKIL